MLDIRADPDLDQDTQLTQHDEGTDAGQAWFLVAAAIAAAPTLALLGMRLARPVNHVREGIS